MAGTSDEIVIHAGRLLAEPGQPAKTAQSVRISGGKIAQVADGYVAPPPGARLIDLKDRFVLPGLIDCHVHLTAQLGPGQLSVPSHTPMLDCTQVHTSCLNP